MDGDDAGGDGGGSGSGRRRGGGRERRRDPRNGMEREVVEDVDPWEEDGVRRAWCWIYWCRC